MTDSEYAKAQPKGKPNYFVGDLIEFKVGGFGVIQEVSEPHNGWPSSYSVGPIMGKKFHPEGKYAWHYELDFKRLVDKSPLRKLDLK